MLDAQLSGLRSGFQVFVYVILCLSVAINSLFFRF